MTPEERNMLADLANKIAQTPPPPRDPEAEGFIRKNIGNRPDALYLMTQTVLIQNMALEQAQQQIQQLQQQAGAGIVPSGGSFLGGRQAAPPPPGYGQPGYGPPPGYGPGPGYGPPQGGGSSFLRSAATTAAGVAGGMLAFQGVEALLGGLGHGGFGGGGGFFGGGGAPGETIIENNYYNDPGRGHESGGSDTRDRFADDSSNSNDNTNLADDGLAPDDNTDYSDASFDDGSSGGGDDLV
ncbi:MAG: DUF2076 family protein [Bryobacteraceae bacterium]